MFRTTVNQSNINKSYTLGQFVKLCGIIEGVSSLKEFVRIDKVYMHEFDDKVDGLADRLKGPFTKRE